MKNRFSNLEYDYRKASAPRLFDTLRLMRIFQSAGIADGCCDICREWTPLSEDEAKQVAGMVKALKTELAKRPHLPNKKARKEIRRKKAQGKYVRD